MQPRSILDLPDEQLAPVSVRPGVIADAQMLVAVRDALLAAFATGEQRVFLDPFAPVAARNAAVLATLRAAIAAQRAEGGPLARLNDDAATLLSVYAATLGWGPAQRYLDDPRVDEVKINSTTIMVQEAGRGFYTAAEQFANADEPRARVVQLASALGVQLDAAHPQETLPVAGGTRVHATIHPRIAAPDAALICIRRGRRSAWTLADLVARGTIDADTVALLRALCAARCSVLIAGRTGSGKTGLLEALANSWPGAPHIVTIEDHTLEIGIADTARWTRELVDTQRDPQAYGRAAREALRQTPGLVVPGETRGAEAGAILALALSGHPVITTLHARTADEALGRFAGYAAQPGAYMYEGRRDDALADVRAAFDVIITIDLFEQLGRRVVTGVALIGSDGRALPLVRLQVAAAGDIDWRHAAQLHAGRLIWEDGIDHTPSDLARRLARTGDGSVQAIPGDDTAIARATRLLGGGETQRALHALAELWRTHVDLRALDLARRALAQDSALAVQLAASAAPSWDRCQQHAAQHNWLAARREIDLLRADLGLYASLPVTALDQRNQQITQGIAQQHNATQALDAAEVALSGGQARAALTAIDGLRAEVLYAATGARLLALRERALGVLVASGAAPAAALETVRRQRDVVEAQQEASL